MTDYSTLLRDHVKLTCRSTDRIFLQAYVPKLSLATVMGPPGCHEDGTTPTGLRPALAEGAAAGLVAATAGGDYAFVHDLVREVLYG